MGQEPVRASIAQGGTSRVTLSWGSVNGLLPELQHTIRASGVSRCAALHREAHRSVKHVRARRVLHSRARSRFIADRRGSDGEVKSSTLPVRTIRRWLRTPLHLCSGSTEMLIDHGAPHSQPRDTLSRRVGGRITNYGERAVS